MKPDNTKWIVLAVVAGIAGALLGPRLLGGLPGGIGLLVAAAILIAVFGYVAYILAGNRVGKAAAPALLAEARRMVAAPGKARIYVVRRGFMGGLAGMKVAIAGVATGQIRMNQFVMAEVPPGTYTVETAMARNGMKPSNSSTQQSLAEGEIVVLRAMLEVHSLHSVTVQQRLPAGEAQSEIANTRLVRWTERFGAW